MENEFVMDFNNTRINVENVFSKQEIPSKNVFINQDIRSDGKGVLAWEYDTDDDYENWELKNVTFELHIPNVTFGELEQIYKILDK